jgi:hypothetical protein
LVLWRAGLSASVTETVAWVVDGSLDPPHPATPSATTAAAISRGAAGVSGLGTRASLRAGAAAG